MYIDIYYSYFIEVLTPSVNVIFRCGFPLHGPTLTHPYMTSVKSITSTIWTFVDKVMSLLFNMLSRFVIAFLPRSKHL